MSIVKKIYNKIIINDNTIIIFGLSSCSYCKKAIKWCQDHDASFKYYNVDKYHKIFINIIRDLIKLDNTLDINPDHNSFPVIFYKKKFIGGYTELINLLK
jgi:glutaredoxin